MRSRKVFRKTFRQTESKEKGTVQHCLELNMSDEACVDEFLKFLCLLSKINWLRTQPTQEFKSSYFVSATSAMNKKLLVNITIMSTVDVSVGWLHFGWKLS